MIVVKINKEKHFVGSDLSISNGIYKAGILRGNECGHEQLWSATPFRRSPPGSC